MTRYYVHGSGRSGPAAWPQQQAPDAVFADHSAATTAREKARLVAAQAPAHPFTLVASSLGAVAAVLAIRDDGLRPHRLVLAEPALYDIGRGSPAVEAHVAAIERARARAAEGDLFGYWEIVKPLMFGSPAARDDWEADRATARRFSAIEPPWGHGLTADDVLVAPTLVVTGTWNAEYEAIAQALVARGARHVPLPGHGHRVQDHPDFEAATTDC